VQSEVRSKRREVHKPALQRMRPSSSWPPSCAGVLDEQEMESEGAEDEAGEVGGGESPVVMAASKQPSPRQM
jgi:hypothetical protein